MWNILGRFGYLCRERIFYGTPQNAIPSIIFARISISYLLGLLVTLDRAARVKALALKVGGGLDNGAQLHQVQEVQVLEPLGPLAARPGGAEAAPELAHAVAPAVGLVEGAATFAAAVQVAGGQVHVDAGVQAREQAVEDAPLQARLALGAVREGGGVAEAVLAVDGVPDLVGVGALVAGEALRVGDQVGELRLLQRLL